MAINPKIIFIKNQNMVIIKPPRKKATARINNAIKINLLFFIITKDTNKLFIVQYFISPIHPNNQLYLLVWRLYDILYGPQTLKIPIELWIS